MPETQDAPMPIASVEMKSMTKDYTVLKSRKFETLFHRGAAFTRLSHQGYQTRRLRLGAMRERLKPQTSPLFALRAQMRTGRPRSRQIHHARAPLTPLTLLA